MENLIYWHGKAIGMDCGSYVSWFPSAEPEAIKALSRTNKIDDTLEYSVAFKKDTCDN